MLSEFGLFKDERKLIYARLSLIDQIMVELAHGLTALLRKHEDRICQLAAREGHLRLLQWARERNHVWGQACEEAARGGHLEVLKWARQGRASPGLWFCRENGHRLRSERRFKEGSNNFEDFEFCEDCSPCRWWDSCEAAAEGG